MTLGLGGWPKSAWRGAWEVKQSDDEERPIEVIVPDVPHEGATITKKLTLDMAQKLADSLKNYLLDLDSESLVDKMEKIWNNKAHKAPGHNKLLYFTTFNGTPIKVGASDVRHISKDSEKILFPINNEEKKSFITLEVTSTEATKLMNQMWSQIEEEGNEESVFRHRV